jgi:hypothetical protein
MGVDPSLPVRGLEPETGAGVTTSHPAPPRTLPDLYAAVEAWVLTRSRTGTLVRRHIDDGAAERLSDTTHGTAGFHGDAILVPRESAQRLRRLLDGKLCIFATSPEAERQMVALAVTDIATLIHEHVHGLRKRGAEAPRGLRKLEHQLEEGLAELIAQRESRQCIVDLGLGQLEPRLVDSQMYGAYPAQLGMAESLVKAAAARSGRGNAEIAWYLAGESNRLAALQSLMSDGVPTVRRARRAPLDLVIAINASAQIAAASRAREGEPLRLAEERGRSIGVSLAGALGAGLSSTERGQLRELG